MIEELEQVSYCRGDLGLGIMGVEVERDLKVVMVVVRCQDGISKYQTVRKRENGVKMRKANKVGGECSDWANKKMGEGSVGGCVRNEIGMSIRIKRREREITVGTERVISGKR